MQQLIVIDNFVPEAYQQSILNLLLGPELGWIYYNYSVSDKSLDEFFYTDEPYKEHIQFRHTFVRDEAIISDYFKFIAPVVGEFQQYMKIPSLKIQRIKSNLLMPQKGISQQRPHVDSFETGRITMLYYVNDSDNSTTFYNEYYMSKPVGLVTKQQTIQAKQGRAVIFDSNQIHAGSCPTEDVQGPRLVLNCIFDCS
jgi:hypothetical protein